MTIEIQIASPPDRENVVAELWIGDEQIAEVSNEDGTVRVEFYARPAPEQIQLSLDELVEALGRAKRNLVS